MPTLLILSLALTLQTAVAPPPATDGMAWVPPG